MQRQQSVARLSWRRVLSAQRRWSLHGTDAALLPSPRPRALFSSASFAAGKDGTAAANWLSPSPGRWGHGQPYRGLSTKAHVSSGSGASPDRATSARKKRAHSADDVAALLPPNQSNAFYDRKMREVLDRGDLRLATAMLERLRELEPNRPVLLSQTYNQLLFVHGQQQQRRRGAHLNQILGVLDEMIAFKRVSSRSFNTALAACSRARDLQKALRVLDQMIAARKNPGVFTYTTVIQCCARKSGDAETAEQLFEQMINDGLEPSVESVRAMLSVYARGPNRSDRMLALCDRARKYFGLPSDKASTDIVVRYLLQSDEGPRAVEFLRRVVTDSDEATAGSVGSGTWSAVLDACRQQDDRNLAEQVERLMSDFRMKRGTIARREKLNGVNALNETGRFDTVETSGGPQADDVESYKLRLTRLSASNELEGAVLLLEEMMRRKIADTSSLDVVLAGCSRSDRLELAEDVLRKVKRSRLESALQPSVLSYNAILNCCAARGDFERAERYFQELYGQGIQPDLVTLNTMLKALANSCDHEDEKRGYLTRSMQAMAFYDWCTSDLGLKPSAITHFTLFRVFAQDLTHESASAFSSGDEQTHEQIVHFIERICRDVPVEALDVGVYNAAIDYFLRFGDTDRVLSMLDVMNARGVYIDDATFGLVFAAASSADDLEMGLNFLHYAMDNNDYQPTVQVMNGAIELCAATHNPGGASELFNSMEASGLLVPDAQSYVQVIRALARVGNVKEAWAFARAMKDRLGYCSLDVYNRVLQACAVSGQPERALDVLAEMTEQEDLIPDVVTYDMVLKAFVKAGAIHAKRHGGHKRGLDDIDEDTEDEEWETAEDDSDPTQLPSATQSTRVGDVILSQLTEMHRYGIAPSSLTYSRAVSACAVRGDRDGVLMVFDDLIAMWERNAASSDNMPSLFSDVTLYEYINACRASDDTQRLLDLAGLVGDDFKRSGGHAVVSSRVLLELMNAFESVGQWRQALLMLRNMDTAYGVSPSVTLFNRAMEMCNAAGEHQSVQLIFLTMQNAPAYLVDPNVGSYIQAIYAAEQLEEWTQATNLFLAMQQNCPKEEIRPSDLQKIALGRYSERSRHDEGDRGGALN